MPKNAEFISYETVETAKQMDAYEKVRLGFKIDGVHYHTIKTDEKAQGFWVVKL